MAQNKSSFHMGDEFNGNGKKTYLRATQHNIYAPLPQHNVRLTPDFSKFALAAIGAMPVGMEGAVATANVAIAMAVLGSVASVCQVKIEKEKGTGKYKTSYFLRKIALTTGSYLHSIGGPKVMLEEFLNKEIEHYTKLGGLLYKIEMPYKKDDYILEGDNRIAVKPHYAGDGYVTIGAGHCIQNDDEANKYGFSTGKKQSNSGVSKCIEEQLKKYGTTVENPAILTMDEARLLLEEDIEKEREHAINAINNMNIGHEFTDNEIDAIASVLFNGNHINNPNSFVYYLLRPDDFDSVDALNKLREADEKGWYEYEGTLRRRLMEYNIYFNNDYTYYDSDELDKLKKAVGW